MKRRTKITIETNRLTVVRQIGKVTQGWCTSCNKQVEMSTPDQIAILFRVSTRKIHRLVEEGKVHFIENTDGLLLVCINSLS